MNIEPPPVFVRTFTAPPRSWTIWRTTVSPMPPAAFGGFRRHERIEDQRQEVLGDAGPGVGDVDLDLVAGRARRDAEPAAAVHRFARVVDQVQEHLCKTVGSRLDLRQLAIVAHDLDASAQAALRDAQRVIDAEIDVGGLRVAEIGAGELREALRQRADVAQAFGGGLEEMPRFVERGALLEVRSRLEQRAPRAFDVQHELVHARLVGAEDQLDRLQAVLHGHVVALDQRAVVDQLARRVIDLASHRRKRRIELVRGRAEQPAERREPGRADRLGLVRAHRVGCVLGLDLGEAQLRRQRALGRELAREPDRESDDDHRDDPTEPGHASDPPLRAQRAPAAAIAHVECVSHASPIRNNAYAATRITPSRRDSSPSLRIIG